MISSFHIHFGTFVTRLQENYNYGQTVPSTDQSRAEGNNTECVGKKRFNGSVTNVLRKEHVLRPPFLDKVLDHIFSSYGYL
jgi:hypothetical protein